MMEMGYKNQSLYDEGFEGATENVVGGNIIFYSDDSCSGDTKTALQALLMINTTPNLIGHLPHPIAF